MGMCVVCVCVCVCGVCLCVYVCVCVCVSGSRGVGVEVYAHLRQFSNQVDAMDFLLKKKWKTKRQFYIKLSTATVSCNTLGLLRADTGGKVVSYPGHYGMVWV